ncbi:lipase 3-like [Sitophilus oryzae]|uniref:Lipase n=1 Tax=Sitophilus oryzae TaxID=7048 RepID=A0A6J2YGN4_SITOR|nr:lipase 3-like [Sitophilus oryzae]
MYINTYLILIFLCNYVYSETFLQILKKYNYPAEEHVIETSDGYILKAQRIPHGADGTQPREVVLLGHGMGGSGENFILLGPPDGLAYYLSDRGFDVWFFNARGSLHSRKHKSLSPDRNRKQFWNFSWHEIATIDLVDTVNYILRVTGKDGLFYVGHSQGTTILMVMLAEHPEMNQKVKAATLLAPSAYLQHTSSPILSLGSKLRRLGESITSMLNMYELPMSNGLILNRFLKTLCNRSSMKDICMDAVYLLGGANSGLVNKTLLPMLIEFIPSSISTKQAWHYGQVIASGEFKQYDYGKKMNQKKYNSPTPPMYNMSNIEVPIGLFYGDSDPFSTPKMIDEFVKVLPNIELVYKAPEENFNHLDYILAYNAKEIINDVLLDKVFKKYMDDNTVD